MPDKIKTKIAPIVKAADLPEEAAKSADAAGVDQWFYATVEAQDREGDIVRVKGIDTAKYAANGGPIKFISGHRQSPAPDGRLPIVGKVMKWVTAKHKMLGVPAMLAGVQFAPSPLGQEFKALYAGDFLTDVSIGFEPVKATPIPGGGFDYEQSAIGELSACITGMNQYAAIVRAMQDEEKTPAPAPTPVIQKFSDEQLAQFKAAFAEITKPILGRLDDLEDSLSALPKGDAPQPDRETHQSDKIDLDRLITLLNGTATR